MMSGSGPTEFVAQTRERLIFTIAVYLDFQYFRHIQHWPGEVPSYTTFFNTGPSA